jgi:signal transduction histidine kinase/DNA-binding response OmpR family regulator
MTSKSSGKLLVVDDNPRNLTAFSAMLEPLGAEIVTAASGEEALRQVLRHDFALILLDVHMPGIDGYETAQMIRARDRSRSIPIIFLTAVHQEQRHVARGYSSGGVDFIVKPVEPDILCSKAAVFLELYAKNQLISEQAEQLRQRTEKELLDYRHWSEARYAVLADDQRRSQLALEMLAELSRRLGELAGDGEALEDVLQLSLPVLGDAALLDLRDAQNGRRRVCATRLEISVPAMDDPRLDLGPTTAEFEGVKQVILDVEQELSGPGEHVPELVRFSSELGVKAYICIPLVGREHVLGSLAFLMSGSGRRYTAADVALAEDVARRLTTALENLRLYELSQRERKALIELGRAKDIFLATLSHELRTPLNAIVGWAHLVKSNGLAAQQRERAVETIDRNARALAKLVADLIDVSRIVSGNLKIDESRVEFRQIIGDAVEAARPSADTAGLELRAELGDSPGEVLGDAARLQQVVGNLLANAVKFTPRGGRVEVRLESNEDRVVLAITDTGPGIAAEFLPHVFEPFRQARRAHERSQEGLGLGLAIVKHLVELHSGSVRAESAGPGQGTTLRVELPLARNAAAGLDILEDSAKPRGTVMAENRAMLAGVHALVVEDDPDGCELLEILLKGFGATVHSVGTAREAMNALRERHPDVLVSDIGLPDEDGFALIRRVRETQEFAELPAVALTAYASKRDVAQALAAGFHAHIAKPVEPGELGSTIARVSGR